MSPMNNRLLVPRKTPGLLDLVPGAAAAYSLRSLSNSYAGPVVTVRRSSDDAEEDFTAAEVADGTLAAFCGAGDGFVYRWWDQSGNANHAVAAADANEPKIVDSGVVVTEEGKPALQFDGSDDYLSADIAGFSSFAALSVFSVFSTPTAAAADISNLRLWCFGDVSTPSYTGILVSSSTGVLSGEKIALTYENGLPRRLGSTTYQRKASEYQLLAMTLLASGTSFVADGVPVSMDLSSSMTTSTSSTPASVGYTSDDLVFIGGARSSGSIVPTPSMKCSEMIFYPSDLTAQLKLAEGNIAWGWSV